MIQHPPVPLFQINGTYKYVPMIWYISLGAPCNPSQSEFSLSPRSDKSFSRRMPLRWVYRETTFPAWSRKDF
jgi:hypothetical protein